jgi:hypothetical protein
MHLLKMCKTWNTWEQQQKIKLHSQTQEEQIKFICGWEYLYFPFSSLKIQKVLYAHFAIKYVYFPTYSHT